MCSFEYVIKDELGLHARPAGMLVKEAKRFESTITVVNGDRRAEAVRLMALMGLGIRQGSHIVVEAEGPDEAEACNEIERFFKENL